MVKISANLGFLWTDISLPLRIERAATAGFSAVECHFPYDHESHDIAAVLGKHGVQMVGLNAGLGSGGKEDFGVAARTGREIEACELIDEAITYAEAVGASYVSVLAGRVSGRDAEQTYIQNLSYACSRACREGINVVIEPMSVSAAPGYFLNTVEQAVSIIETVDAPNMKLMFDCFHTQVDQGALTERLRRYSEHLGHVQISSVPDRAEPDTGEINYRHIFKVLDDLGYQGWVGAEYHPNTTVEDGLAWLKEMV